MSGISPRICTMPAALLTAVLVASLAPVAAADVTITQKVSMASAGGFLDMDMDTETMTKGDKQCMNSKMEMKSELFGMFGDMGPMESSTITRLDKDLVWELQHDMQSYTEQTLAEMKARMQGEPDADDPFGGMEGERSGQGFDSEEYEWSEPTFTVEKTGKKEKIAGYSCEQSIVKMEMEGKHVETGEKVKMLFDMDMMLAKDIAELAEVDAFEKKYAEAVGMEEWTQSSFAFGMLSMVSEYGIDKDQLAEEAKKMEGYPLRMKMKLRGEGSQFDEMSGQGMTEEDKKELEEAKKALKSFGGLFGGDDDEDEGEAEAEKETEVTTLLDPGTILEMNTEVTKISTTSIPDDRFEVPADYEKTEDGSD